MNSMERIQATLAGKPVDQRPFAPVLSLYGARLTGCPLREYYTDPAAYARGQTAVLKTFHPDVLCAPLAYALIGEAFGSQLHCFETMPPNVRRPGVSSLRQWDTLIPPDPDTNPQFLFLREAIRQMATEHGDRVPIAMPIPCPVDIPILAMGIEAWLETVLFDPDGARRVMEIIIPLYIKLVNRFFEEGAALVVMPAAFASPAVVTREILKDFTRPILAEVLAHLRGPVLLHCGGAPMLPHLDLLTGLPSVVGFIPDQLDDFARTRQIVGPDSVIFGGLNAINFPEITDTEVEEYYRGILENQCHEIRFAVGNSGPDIPWETPPENIHAVRRAIETFGQV